MLRSVPALGLAVALMACSITESSLIIPDPGDAHEYVGASDRSGARGNRRFGAETGSVIRCRSDLGFYYLSKSLIKAKLERRYWLRAGERIDYEKAELADGTAPYRLTVEAPIHVPDTGKGYCFDFFGSPTSHDLVRVERSRYGLLKSVSTLADDQSVEIAKHLIDIIFIGISGLADPLSAIYGRGTNGSAEEEWETVLDVSYDPMVPMQAALLNERLKDYGFCLILGEEPPEEKRDFGRYCSDPVGYLSRHDHGTDAFVEEEPEAAAHDAGGIFYRPRRPYSYYIMKKENRKKHGHWQLNFTETINLENRSPVLLIGTDRTFFAKRRTKLTFDDGALKHIELDKTSELLGAVEIPLYLAQNIVALPAAIIKVDLDFTVQQTQLIGHELELIKKIEDVRAVQAEVRRLKLERLTAQQAGAAP